MLNLTDRIVFVTGASAGIGRVCAERFAREGASVIVCARREDRIRELADSLASTHGLRTLPLRLDVSDREAVKAAVRGLPEDWKAIDVLVNNAGKALGLGSTQDADPAHIEGMIDTNLKGLLWVTRAVLPGMLARKRGHVINIGSVAGRWVYPGGSVYCATKHAVRALNEGLKMDVHGSPVRVTSVDPGLVETEFSLVRFEGDADKASRVYADMTPLTGDDVADAVAWAATRPPHVNIGEIMLTCVDQSHATMVNRPGRPDRD